MGFKRVTIPAVQLRLIQCKRRVPLLGGLRPRVRGNLVCWWLVADEGGSLLPGRRLRRLHNGGPRGELLGLRYRRLVSRRLVRSALLRPGHRLRRLDGGLPGDLARLRSTSNKNRSDGATEDS